MTTSLVFACQHPRFRDRPACTEPNDDPRASLQAAVHWHFGPDTGSRYWTLGFNSMAEAMADKLQHRSQDPSEIGNWAWDPPQ
jgi:hypothetical protein